MKFVLAILALMLCACKAKHAGLEPELSSSAASSSSSQQTASLAHVDTLAVGQAWHVDSISASDTVWYRVAVHAGRTYFLQWDDSLDGTHARTADVRVQVFNAAGDSAYWFLNEDNGYATPKQVVATDSVVLVRILPKASGTFAFRILDWPGLLIPSSSQGIP